MPSEERSGQEERKRQRRWLAVAVAVTLVVAVVAGVWAAKGAWTARGGLPSGAPSSPAAPMPDTRTIDLTSYGLTCPGQPTWSPNGKLIAVLAIGGSCLVQTHGLVQTIAIFDARTGALMRTFPLSRTLAAQGFAAGGFAAWTFQFAWTPDSASLVLGVNTGIPPEQLPSYVKHGLAIISVATGAVRTFADPSPMPQVTQASTLIWDTQTGALAHVAAGLPFAPAYTWGADGLPMPSAAGKGMEGKGGVGFWQAGSIAPAFKALHMGGDVPSSDPPQAFYYFSTTPQWSPDGRYVALPLMLGARLPGGSSPRAIQTGDDCPDHFTLACQSPAVAIPDAGFAAALKAAEVGWVQRSAQIPYQFPQWSSQDVAWRADGQEVATMLPGQSFNSPQPTARVTIFNTQTGAPTQILTVTRMNTTPGGKYMTPQFAWAPSGSSLVLANYSDGTLTIWRSV